MPSLQTALPPELANHAIRLYRECSRRAKYIGQKKYNTELLITMVREQFKKNMQDTDPDTVQKMKDEYVSECCFRHPLSMLAHVVRYATMLQED